VFFFLVFFCLHASGGWLDACRMVIGCWYTRSDRLAAALVPQKNFFFLQNCGRITGMFFFLSANFFSLGAVLGVLWGRYGRWIVPGHTGGPSYGRTDTFFFIFVCVFSVVYKFV
jgi:hypothetical protein